MRDGLADGVVGDGVGDVAGAVQGLLSRDEALLARLDLGLVDLHVRRPGADHVQLNARGKHHEFTFL